MAGAGRLARYRKPAVVTRAAPARVDAAALDAYLHSLGADGQAARRLDADVDAAVATVVSLSSLTTPLALDYLDRLSRPIPALRPQVGVQLFTRAYMAHAVVEADPAAYGAAEVPGLDHLPPPGRAVPQDLLSRAVKASRRHFERVRAVSAPVWDGFVRGLVRRAHDAAGPDDELLSIEVVDGLARFGWVLRQVDVHYGLGPDRR